MSKKRREYFNPVELPDNVDQLLELHSQELSLVAHAENELKLRRSEMALIKAKLKKVRGELADIHVSDHAVARYLERVAGIDIEACKREMISKLPKDYKVSDTVEFVELDANGLHYVIRDGLIITVSPYADDFDTRSQLRPHTNPNASKAGHGQ